MLQKKYKYLRNSNGQGTQGRNQIDFNNRSGINIPEVAERNSTGPNLLGSNNSISVQSEEAVFNSEVTILQFRISCY